MKHTRTSVLRLKCFLSSGKILKSLFLSEALALVWVGYELAETRSLMLPACMLRLDFMACEPSCSPLCGSLTFRLLSSSILKRGQKQVSFLPSFLSDLVFVPWSELLSPAWTAYINTDFSFQPLICSLLAINRLISFISKTAFPLRGDILFLCPVFLYITATACLQCLNLALHCIFSNFLLTDADYQITFHLQMDS